MPNQQHAKIRQEDHNSTKEVCEKEACKACAVYQLAKAYDLQAYQGDRLDKEEGSHDPGPTRPGND